MQAITTIGLDIAKSVFQVHGVDADGGLLCRRFGMDGALACQAGESNAPIRSGSGVNDSCRVVIQNGLIPMRDDRHNRYFSGECEGRQPNVKA